MKKQKRDLSEKFPEDVVKFPMNQDNPEEVLDKKDVSEYIHKLIKELPEHYRLVLTLFHLEEFSV